MAREDRIEVLDRPDIQGLIFRAYQELPSPGTTCSRSRTPRPSSNGLPDASARVTSPRPRIGRSSTPGRSTSPSLLQGSENWMSILNQARTATTASVSSSGKA